ncbi:multiple monosaccharide ABC transporter substrate-binding protein [Microbacterium terrisoli]|jgi:putative multiple sugar transport system substrate-binding protein|uniref:multiple monosaccharide ABC transporter substrate-binding protein n=1 Tax=Microbacterium terrisoli TaxID=3242192 RepID=UPI002804B336|nr:multiple monosaccharide ABC transporter substrate-binding protein [Microbacterium protaetiae]
MSFRTKKLAAVVAVGAAIALSISACSGGGRGGTAADDSNSATVNKGALVGIAMPTKVDQRWIQDGNNVQKYLQDAGYKTDLEYANNDIPTQGQQIESMITKGAKVLVIASIDGGALGQQLDDAKAAGVKVISYDRLLTGDANVDYYATFDNFKVGVLQADSLLTGLGYLDDSGAKTGKTGPWHIEIFAGSPDDNNATFFYNGAMSVLKPLIDAGTLVVTSGQTAFNQTAIQGWDPATAKKRMDDLLAKSYSTGATKLNGILSPYDGLSDGIIAALESGGYKVGSTDWPIITGQDAEVASVKQLIAGSQYSTIFKDTRLLAKQAVAMTEALLQNKKPEVNDTKSYDNGKKVVPTYLLPPVVVTVDNYQKELIDSGYYTAADLK